MIGHSLESANSKQPEQAAASSGTALHEDVLTHLTKSAVQSVSDGLNLGLSEQTSTSIAQWIDGAAKSVPLFVPGGGVTKTIAYGAAAALYGMSEMKWGDSTDNQAKDAVLGGLKGLAMKGSMELIGRGANSLGLEGKFWSAPATGVAFGASSTLIESGLSRSTYHNSQGKYLGLAHGLDETAGAVFNLANLATSAATFTLGAGMMKGLQVSPLASKFPELMGSRVFQNATVGFSFGTFSGMAGEANRQSKEGHFSAWELNKFDYGMIGYQGLFQATSDAAGAALGGKLGAHSVGVENVPHSQELVEIVPHTQELVEIVPHTQELVEIVPHTHEPVESVPHIHEPVENVPRIHEPAGQLIRSRDEIDLLVESPLRKAVASLWDMNVRTVGSGVEHDTEPKWSTLGFVPDVGEYEAPYYKFTIDKDGRYRDAQPPPNFEGQSSEAPSSEQQKRVAFIRLDGLTLSAENQRIARQFGRPMEDNSIELSVPAEHGTPTDVIEKGMLELVSQFEPQPMTWGFRTPLQFYRSVNRTGRGFPTEDWMNETFMSPEFFHSGMELDFEHNLFFASPELAGKYRAAPPPEPTWYRGPEIVGALSGGGLRLAYNQAAVHLYTPAGQHIEAPDPATARIPARSFDLNDLTKPENADYYLANKNRFFELFGSEAYDSLADRHWLELRNKAFESVEKHWPTASIEKDHAKRLGTIMLARAARGLGHVGENEAGLIESIVPRYLWREPSGRNLSAPEVIDIANKIYDDMDEAGNTPFDHTFARQLIDRAEGASGDSAADSYQFHLDRERNLAQILTSGWSLQIHPKYIPLMQEIEQHQKSGSIPDHFEKSTDPDGLQVYKPVYRAATTEEQTIPLSELVKNLKIVDYGFKDKNGEPSLGKISLASHDIHDHARVFWLLQKEGLFDEQKGERSGYRNLLDKLSDPQDTGIFKREGELVASVAYDWRNFFEHHSSSQPQIDLNDIRHHFLWADGKEPLSVNQSNALAYIEHLLDVDPQQTTSTSKQMRNILGGVWHETLEQKRKTENTLWQRSDGSYQRMSALNPEFLAFVIDAARIINKHEPELVSALNQNNLKMESYLQSIAKQSDDSSLPPLHFTPADITAPRVDEPIEFNVVPQQTVDWLIHHLGFNTRRAPIRHWLTGQQELDENAQARQAGATTPK